MLQVTPRGARSPQSSAEPILITGGSMDVTILGGPISLVGEGFTFDRFVRLGNSPVQTRPAGPTCLETCSVGRPCGPGVTRGGSRAEWRHVRRRRGAELAERPGPRVLGKRRHRSSALQSAFHGLHRLPYGMPKTYAVCGCSSPAGLCRRTSRTALRRVGAFARITKYRATSTRDVTG